MYSYMQSNLDESNISKYTKITRLASCLVSLRELETPMSSTQVDKVVKLWNALDDYDKARITFTSRFSASIDTGILKKTAIEGVTSIKRVICHSTIEKIGRRFTMAFEFFVFTVFVLLSNMCTSRPVLTFFLFVARAFISGAFQAAYVYTPEVYPTSMRAIGLGSCSGMARVGAIVTPFVAQNPCQHFKTCLDIECQILISSQVMLRESSYLAISTYGVMAMVATVISIVLPIETKGKEMKDTGAELTVTQK